MTTDNELVERRGSAEQAIDFILEYGVEADFFLHAWREGDFTRWPEYLVWLAEQPALEAADTIRTSGGDGVERAAKALHGKLFATITDWRDEICEWDELPEHARSAFRYAATAALEAEKLATVASTPHVERVIRPADGSELPYSEGWRIVRSIDPEGPHSKLLWERIPLTAPPQSVSGMRAALEECVAARRAWISSTTEDGDLRASRRLETAYNKAEAVLNASPPTPKVDAGEVLRVLEPLVKVAKWYSLGARDEDPVQVFGPDLCLRVGDFRAARSLADRLGREGHE